jgi:hypothetical protein
VLGKRYAPFAVLASGIMLLVIVAPSRPAALSSSNPFAQYAGAPTAGAQAAVPGQAAGTAAPGAATPSAAVPGATGATAPNGAGAPAVTGASHASGATGTGPASGSATQGGDTSHCVNGRQFGELRTAPPCTPRFTGDNGGSTWAGVTKDTIEFVYYREKDNPAVKAIEQAGGLYSNPPDQAAFLQVAQDFVNSHFELYGRKLHIDFYQGNCSPAPPNPQCDRNDADTIVQTYHPFMVLYDNNSNLPEFYDQLARDQTMSMGGWHFADTFDTQLRPWHWDVYMGGLYQAELTGEWWCKRMAGHAARYAGDPALQSQTRKAAIITPQYPTNVESANHLAAIINQCAPGTAEVIPYASDTTTATAQANSDVSKEKQDGITSLLWFSDPIAPVYGTVAEDSQRYYPEEVIVGSGLLDYDALAQLYDQNEWKNAFGPSDIQDQPSFTNTDAAIVWHTQHQAGDPYSSANLPWAYLATFAYIVNQVGPNLNPGTFEQAAFRGPYENFWKDAHDTSHPYITYGPDPSTYGAYAGIHDEREVAWDPNATSPVNGKRGAYRTLENHARFSRGAWPSTEFAK